MRGWRTPAVALGTCLAVATLCRAQLPQAPTYRYPVVPTAGAWMICVKSYKGPEAQALAEEMAEYIRKEYQLPAFLFDWGHKQRAEEGQRIAELRKKHEQWLRTMGGTVETAPFRVKTVRIEDQYAVLVGGWQDMDTARKALTEVRKLKPPPEKLVDKVVQAVGPEGQGESKTAAEVKYAALNPFLTALVVPNPVAPKPKTDDDKPDPILKELNAGNKYSPLGNHKDWTLVVKVFNGTTQVQAQTGGILGKLFGGNKAGEVLNASALQAEQLAGFLRQIKEAQIEAYVLHTRFQSIVTVGQFDGPEDPKLADAMAVVSKLQFKAESTDPAVAQLMQLNPQPLPMKIPRP